MWGGAKKKLRAAQGILDQKKIELASKEGELAGVNQQIEASDAAVLKLRADVESEKAAQNIAEEEIRNLQAEFDKESAATVDARAELEASKIANENAKLERERLLQELAEAEESIKEEHATLEASAGAARREAAQIQTEQEQERQKWVSTRQAHERLKQQLDASMQQLEQATSERDAARIKWTADRDRLKDLQMSHDHLVGETERIEQMLAAELEKRPQLEKEIASLSEQLTNVTAAHAELEATSWQRTSELAEVTGELDRKKDVLERELSEFQQRFQMSKRERLRSTNDYTC